ncbi:head-tail adaptor protein [uncultured Sulfitobacter sp.]|uniref:head-tail adaptor protein n=1 Tax=uncultured Sulfitobacter sp. TaxID=191468 RepID=UPI0030DDD06A|tara:strand:- start:12544 stop:12879 length:336 start_codon:yes stop_codon:yes gene_type:complete
MMGAGRFRHNITFNRQDLVDDGYGNVTGEFKPLFSTRGNVRETPGKERVAAGSVEGIITCTLRVYASAQAKGLTAGDQAVARGQVWNLETPTFADEKGRYLDIKGTAGGAQ